MTSENCFAFESLAKKLRNKNFVIDVGSNDGILLKPLKKRGVRCLGIDPSINVGRIAKSCRDGNL